ncbi:hypothetical protein GCM10009844_25580 [Nocardioides koreensis]|uniref:SHOCT domain-containing protein n=1 Tax=Nocardioides koreensis TaxID=433651 RepID=A0ABP5LLD9_9ACTN
MRPAGRLLLGLVGAALAVLAVAGAASAAGGDNPPARCLRPNRYGELPTCTWDGTSWHRSFGGGMSTGGPPAGFVALFVLVLLGGVGVLVWKVSTARRMARESGMSAGDATAMTLLTDDGFGATYLAANLRDRTHAAPAPPPAAGRTVSERLQQLQALRDQGLVTVEEYDARRAAILDSL